MSDNSNLGYELNWDDEISQESEFEILPEGEYSFSITKMEKARYDGSEKMAACNVAVIYLKVTNEEGLSGSVIEKLYLNSKAEWKLSQFFTSIGQKKKGEPLKPRWNEVTGATGKLKLTINKYTDKDGNSRENNRVDSFLPHEMKTYQAGAF
jgi:phage protein